MECIVPKRLRALCEQTGGAMSVLCAIRFGRPGLFRTSRHWVRVAAVDEDRPGLPDHVR